MKITDLLHLSAIDLKAKAENKNDAIESAVKTICKTGAIVDVDKYKNGVFKREGESTTGVGDGIAIPHCKSDAVKEPALAALVFKDGVDYESLDGEKVNLLFLIAAPDTADNVHLDVLAKLSNVLMHSEFVFALKKASSPETFMKILDYAEASLDLAKAKDEVANKESFPRILAATACPTGIAHTYMAQEALEKAGKAKGVTIKVETNGSGGVKNALTDEEIEHADGIIVAADAFVEMDRFVGKRVIEVPVSSAIKDAGSLIDMALDPITSIYRPGETKKTKQDKKMEGSKFHIFYKHLMSGISHMIPFVVAGGILLAIAYLIDGIAGSPKTGATVIEYGKEVHYDFGSVNIGARIFHILGGDLGLGLMLPVLGGFIAYSIAGKPGLVSGFIGSFACKQGKWSLLYWITRATGNEDWCELVENSAAGFLGAIVAGFLAGYLVLFLKKKLSKLPRTLEGIKDMLIIPLTSTALVAVAMLLVNVPLSFVNIGINKGIMALNNVGAVVAVAALVSGLMATDMGGPINKAAHYATLAILTDAIKTVSTNPQYYELAQRLMCANIVGIMTPPIGIAIATWLFPQKFSKGDRNPSIANCVTGVCGITEGAIPYVTKDPVRVLISTVTGAAAGGMISFAFGGRAIAPEGGTISMMVMGGICWAGLLATLIGSFITAFILGLLKKDVAPEEAELGKWKGIPTQPVYNFFGKIGNGIGKIFKKGNKKSVKKSKDKKEGK